MGSVILKATLAVGSALVIGTGSSGLTVELVMIIGSVIFFETLLLVYEEYSTNIEFWDWVFHLGWFWFPVLFIITLLAGFLGWTGGSILGRFSRR